MTRLTRPLEGLDYTGAIAGTTLNSWGTKFVARYLSNFPWKNLSPQEAANLRAHRIGIVTVWEDGAGDAFGGFALGRSHAEQHVAMARHCGKKDGIGFYYFAVDTDVAGHPEHTDAYFDGIASVIPKAQCGPYGGIQVVSHQLNRGFAAGWQTIAWSSGQLDSRAKLHQYMVANVGQDRDHAWYADYGQWQWVPPVPAVNHHYERFHPGPLRIGNKFYDERTTVKRFDHIETLYRPHTRVYTAQRKALKADIKLLRDRIMTVAQHGKGFNLAWRGWRWQQLNDRLKEQ